MHINPKDINKSVITKVLLEKRELLGRNQLDYLFITSISGTEQTHEVQAVEAEINKTEATITFLERLLIKE